MSGAAGGESTLSASVFGGSFVGLDSADVALDPSDPNYDPAAGSTQKFTANSDGAMGDTTPQSLLTSFFMENPKIHLLQ